MSKERMGQHKKELKTHHEHFNVVNEEGVKEIEQPRGKMKNCIETLTKQNYIMTAHVGVWREEKADLKKITEQREKRRDEKRSDYGIKDE